MICLQFDYGPHDTLDSERQTSHESHGMGISSEDPSVAGQEYEYEETGSSQQQLPAPPLTEEQIRQLKMYEMMRLQQQQQQQNKNPFAPPPFPSSGYGTAGVGYSSAGNGGNPSNKAFIPFFGYVDPVVLIAIVAFPVLCTLGVTSLLMPIIPIVIYIIGLIFPSSRNNLSSSPRNNSRMKRVMTNRSHPIGPVTPVTTDLEHFLRLLNSALDRF